VNNERRGETGNGASGTEQGQGLGGSRGRDDHNDEGDSA
jgi:hypothetical protein